MSLQTETPLQQFELTEPQKMLRQTVRELTLRHIAPRAAEIDEADAYPEDIFQLHKAHDLLGVFLSEEWDGGGMGFLGGCIAIEEIGRICSNSALFIVLTMLPSRAIELSGSEAQKKRYLPALARGELRAAFSLTEPHAGSDAGNIRTRAVREGEEWVINGVKSFCTGPSAADFIILAAKTDPDAGTRGITMFIVPTDTPGFRITRHERKLGMRGIPTCELLFENCRIPAENQVGPLHQGFKTAMTGFSQMRPAIGARGVGLAQGCLDYAGNYAKEREAFGKPIAEFQAIQFMLADMFMGIEAARLLVHRAAAMVDAGQIGKENARFFSTAKCFAADVAMKAALDGLQVLGGAGYMKDHPLERFMRDAKQLQIVEGTNQIQRMIIARNLLDI
ncbi:MAG: acyl-CoA dehydrogenase family protein [bacterium]